MPCLVLAAILLFALMVAVAGLGWVALPARDVLPTARAVEMIAAKVGPPPGIQRRTEQGAFAAEAELVVSKQNMVNPRGESIIIPYTITEVMYPDYGARTRIRVNITAPSATTDREMQQVVEDAALEIYSGYRPDAVQVLLYEPSTTPGHYFVAAPLFGAVYAPDGCGWKGDDCHGRKWQY